MTEIWTWIIWAAFRVQFLYQEVMDFRMPPGKNLLESVESTIQFTQLVYSGIR